tara:strand:- start:274 stop:492 length:219 start_codon:yes stop_codon:yes gene_type:complete
VKTILKIIMAPVVAYFGLNWAADNPMKMKYLRNQVDQRAESGYEFALFQFKSYSSEPVVENEKKKKSKKNRQ